MTRALAPLAVVAVVALTGCTDLDRTAGTPVPVVAAVTMPPQPLPAPARDRLAQQVPAGTVQHEAGAFDDRFALTRARLSDGRVDAALEVVQGVSEVVVVAVVVDFYDADGDRLGRTWRTHAHDGGRVGRATAGVVRLELQAEPSYRSEVASAVLSVPVLVDE